MTAPAFEHLSAAFGFEHSELFPRILDHLMSEDEAEIMSALPGTPRALAEAISRPLEPLSAELHDLYLRGLVFIGEHTAAGVRPLFVDILEAEGYELPADMFMPTAQ